MNNRKKYQECFIRVFNVKEEQLKEEFSILCVNDWDSVAQMRLVAEIEDTFDIILDPEDIMELTSYQLGIELLEKMGIEL